MIMTIESYKPQTVDETAVLELYHRLLEAWNERDAHQFAHLFSGTAHVIGFDGSQMYGQAQVESELKNIFSSHQTGRYIAKVRDIRHLDSHCLLLSSVAGMIPANSIGIDPSKNAIQSLIAVKNNGAWYIELFQNTPAQFHGRPELSESLVNELKELT
jgi:uncharacterized protein (TIGR02246 family)